MKMGMAEPVFCDGIAKGVTVGEDEFQNLLGILDFPMESLEGDDELSGDWDASKSQSLGPIPSEALMGFPPVPQGNLGDAFSNAPPKLKALLVMWKQKGGGTLKPKELPNYAKQSSSAHFGHENVLSDTQESGVFQTQSPVSVLESGGSCSGGKSLPIKPHITIPVRTRSKRARASVSNPWFLMTPISSSTSAFKKTSSYMKSKDKEGLSEALLASNTVLEITHDSSKQGKEELFHAVDVAENDETSLQRSVPAKKCTHCQVTKTPQWREGPMGPKTLCNACGVRYRSGRLFPEYRPLASPSFVPTLHSNSHRKVVEMRKKAIMQEPGIIHETPISQATEIIPELHLNSRRKVLGMRNKAVLQDNDFVYDASMSPSPPPDFVPKRRKVVGMRKQAFMQENDILHSAAVSPAPEPEPVPDLDSNSPRKFMGIRKEAIMQETDIINDSPMSPAPEFVPMSRYLFDFIY